MDRVGHIEVNEDFLSRSFWESLLNVRYWFLRYGNKGISWSLVTTEADKRCNIHTIALQDGSTTDILSHPTYGSAYADNRVEDYHTDLTSLLIQPQPRDILFPWSQLIDEIASEEHDTPDPTSLQTKKSLCFYTARTNTSRSTSSLKSCGIESLRWPRYDQLYPSNTTWSSKFQPALCINTMGLCLMEQRSRARREILWP